MFMLSLLGAGLFAVGFSYPTYMLLIPGLLLIAATYPFIAIALACFCDVLFGIPPALGFLQFPFTVGILLVALGVLWGKQFIRT